MQHQVNFGKIVLLVYIYTYVDRSTFDQFGKGGW